MMYYSHIHSDIINPLIKEAFDLNKYMHDNGIFRWYTFAKEILPNLKQIKVILKLSVGLLKLLKSLLKKYLKHVYEHYEKQLTEKLSLINDSSKHFLYSKLKSDIKVILHQFWVKTNIPENSF